MLKALKRYFTDNKVLVIAITSFILYIYCKAGNKYVPIEEIAIPSAIGCDIENANEEEKYGVSLSIYTYSGNKVETNVFTGKANTVPETRSTRQVELTGKFLLGLEKVVVMSDEAARFGIKNFLEALWVNPTLNDNSYFVVSKEKAEDILNFKAEGNKSSGDYIDNLIRHLASFNFFSKNYKMIDVLIRAESEGRSIVLPYIEVKDGKLKVTGMALFSKDKLVKSIGLEEARIMNLLRESNVQGIIQIKKSTKSYFSFYGTSKRTVDCKLADGKFVFDIKLKIKGTVAANSMYKNLVKDPELKKAIEEDLEREAEKLSYGFIEKMQKDYKVDCLELGRCAAEKYGRRKNIDWDKVVSESQINVTVDVKIVDIGRGDL